LYGKIIDEQNILKDVEGSGLSLIEILSHNLPGGSEDNSN
jgi:hypothetical protein